MEAEYYGSANHETSAKQLRVGSAMLGWLRWTWLRTIVRTMLGAAAFIALVVMALGGPASKHGVESALGIRWAAALVFIIASLILLRIGRILKDVPDQGKPLGMPISTSSTPEELSNARHQASLKYTPEVLDLFSRILGNSSQYVTRAVENAEVRDGCLCLQVIMEFALNDQVVKKVRNANESVVLIPLIKLAKGATLDNLDLSDREGRHVSPLLQDEIYGLLTYVIDSLFRIAYINGSGKGASRSLTKVEEAVLGGLVQVACYPEKVDSKDISPLLHLLDSVGAASNPVNAEAALDLHHLCEFFAENYLIAVEAELPSGSRLTMKYSRTVPLYEQAAVRADRSRVRLGLSPRSFSLPLTLPFEAPSYHFSMSGVPGSFVARQTLFETPNRNVIGQETFMGGKTQPYLSSKCESALPYAHFHARGLQRFSDINMWTRVEFDEVPPGALGGAMVVCVACAILIWFFTLVQPGLRSPSQQIASDLPALLLTVPAFAATWIGNSADRIQRSSICTYIGLGISTVVSLASALLYIANANHKSFLTIRSLTFGHGLVRLNGVDVAWLILALIASLMSAYLAEKLRDKVRNYMKLLANDSESK